MKSSLRTFAELPTLKSWPLLGHNYLFLPGGKYNAQKLTEAVADISKTLGTIFRLRLGGRDMVITVDADHTEKMHRNEGTKPARPTFPALYHYRKKTFNSVGIVPGNGDEWHRLRSGVNPLLTVNVYEHYIPLFKAIAKEFAQYIPKHCDTKNVLQDVRKHLEKFGLEASSMISPGHKFNCILKTNPESDAILKANNDFMEGLYDTLIKPPFWKLYRTSGYKKLESSHQVTSKIMRRHIVKMKEKFECNAAALSTEQPFMQSLFLNKSLTEDDRIMLSLELFIAGIDTTATTGAFALYYLAKNKEIQEQARQEALKESYRYLKACIKETLRLCPTAGASSRFLAQDTEIGGYFIPKDTLVSAFTSVTSSQERYFKDSQRFNPNRWLRDTIGYKVIHKFASLPFGYGARMCPGVRIAENELAILLKEVLCNYEVHPANDKEIGMIYKMNRVPETPINLKFTKLKN